MNDLANVNTNLGTVVQLVFPDVLGSVLPPSATAAAMRSEFSGRADLGWDVRPAYVELEAPGRPGRVPQGRDEFQIPINFPRSRRARASKTTKTKG